MGTRDGRRLGMDSVAGPELLSVARCGGADRIASRRYLNENRAVHQPHQNRPTRPPRAESREVLELKKLKDTNPELAPAIDMQLALVELQRRVQSRVPIPTHRIDQARVQQHYCRSPTVTGVRGDPPRLD